MVSQGSCPVRSDPEQQALEARGGGAQDEGALTETTTSTTLQGQDEASCVRMCPKLSRTLHLNLPGSCSVPKWTRCVQNRDATFLLVIDLFGAMALWAIALRKSLGQLNLPRAVDNSFTHSSMNVYLN